MLNSKYLVFVMMALVNLNVANKVLGQTPYSNPYARPLAAPTTNPYSNPYSNGGYGASGWNASPSAARYAATRPVSYTFPVRRDYATAYALQTDPRWGQTPQRGGLEPVTAYRPVSQLNRPNYGSQYASHPGYRPGTCSVGQPGALAPRSVAPGYPGTGLFGSQKLYADGEPVRNFFRFLTP